MIKARSVLGFFVSCGYASDPSYYGIAIRDFIEKSLKKIGVKPDLTEALSGIFDFSKDSKLNTLDRKILRIGDRDLRMKIDYNIKNDYRNWKRVHEFSVKINKLVG